jgi:hypothetical protein
MRRLLPLFLLASCTTQREWRQVAATVQVGASTTMNDGSVSNGKRSYDMAEGDRVFVAFNPLAYLEPPREVIVVQPPAPKPCPPK